MCRMHTLATRISAIPVKMAATRSGNRVNQSIALTEYRQGGYGDITPIPEQEGVSSRP